MLVRGVANIWDDDGGITPLSKRADFPGDFVSHGLWAISSCPTLTGAYHKEARPCHRVPVWLLSHR